MLKYYLLNFQKREDGHLVGSLNIKSNKRIDEIHEIHKFDYKNAILDVTEISESEASNDYIELDWIEE